MCLKAHHRFARMTATSTAVACSEHWSHCFRRHLLGKVKASCCSGSHEFACMSDAVGSTGTHCHTAEVADPVVDVRIACWLHRPDAVHVCDSVPLHVSRKHLPRSLEGLLQVHFFPIPACSNTGKLHQQAIVACALFAISVGLHNNQDCFPSVCLIQAPVAAVFPALPDHASSASARSRSAAFLRACGCA